MSDVSRTRQKVELSGRSLLTILGQRKSATKASAFVLGWHFAEA
ncbi:hypothetical protein UF75_2566 [Desulfosporosinus sp. I2]|nr:hypothetical protein UF75_2566 [Desulfosporosinus sp. I2]